MVFCCFYSCCVCDCGMRQRRREYRLLRSAKRGDASVMGRLVIELRVNANCRYFMVRAFTFCYALATVAYSLASV